MEKLDIFAKDCPARFPLQVISGKWGLLVILALEKKPLRFSELVHNIGGISERMASQTLKYLEQIGVVRREVLQRSKPPQVYYELTSLGRRAGRDGECACGYDGVSPWLIPYDCACESDPKSCPRCQSLHFISSHLIDVKRTC